jgi:dTDP-4-dehydrorhamnose reductase
MTFGVYITGASGQVGGEIQRLFPHATYLNRNEVDLSSPASIEVYFKKNRPKIIVNCSAYTQVDMAEKERDIAHAVNAIAPGILSGLCDKFIHFSTDYVFNGQGCRPYLETDITGPNGVYALTKLHGEQAVLLANPKAIVIRTSWVYSDIGKNFVKTMLKFGAERSELKVVADQIGSPTYAQDLAKLVVEHGLRSWNFKGGIYHYSNEGLASWYDFAYEIMKLKGLSCKVLPIRTEDYPTPAARPHYSVLDKTKIKNELGITIPHWKDSLELCLKKLP